MEEMCSSFKFNGTDYLLRNLKDIKEITITQPVQSNGVFVIIPHDVAEKMQKHYFFYPWNEDDF
ncbi:MAG: hypothetical protein MZV63_03155 [Marinilabiliales bacterium]|nr:hypothetical protein [Marinilabiliales bacterium]